jgi:hypothetical protein
VQIYRSDLRDFIYKGITHLMANCPRCGRSLDVDLNELNYCLNCGEEIEITFKTKPPDEFAEG